MERTIQEIYANKDGKLTGREVGRLYIAVSVSDFTGRGMPIMSVNDVMPLIQKITTPKDRNDLNRCFNLELVLRKYYRIFNDVYPDVILTLLQAMRDNITRAITITQYNLETSKEMQKLTDLTDSIQQLSVKVLKSLKMSADADGIAQTFIDNVSVITDYITTVSYEGTKLAVTCGEQAYIDNAKEKIKTLLQGLQTPKKDVETVTNLYNPLPRNNQIKLYYKTVHLLRLITGYNYYIDMVTDIFNVPHISMAYVKDITRLLKEVERYNDEVIASRKVADIDTFVTIPYQELIDIPYDIRHAFYEELKKSRAFLKTEKEIEAMFFHLPFYWDYKLYKDAKKKNYRLRWEYEL